MIKQTFCTFVFFLVVCSLRLSAQLPDEYDLRDHDLVTPVKKQKSGTCWCHGTMSGIEGNLLVTGNWEAAGEQDEPNMAEYHLSYWNGFSQCWNYDLYPRPDTGSGPPTHNGGDYKIFAAYMSRLEGSVREVDAPGDLPLKIPSQDQIPLYKDTYHIWYVPDIDWFFIDGDGPQGSLENIDTIKQVLMRNGVMPTNYLVGSSYMQDWNGYKTHYQPPTSSGDANHSVAIVGWNDNCITKAGSSKKGAWLCKNSWGNIQDYFYISYYDKHCCRNAEMSVVAFKGVKLNPYSNVYYHDYHGWRDTLSIAKEAFNKFIADCDEPEYLTAVSFITAVDHEEYEVKIYDNYENGELKDELASVSGSIVHMGYHTRDLNHTVLLEDGDDFYIYVKFKNGFQAYDRTCSPPVLTETPPKDPIVVWSKAEADQSYYRTGPTEEWIDLTTYEETINVNGMIIDCQGSQNFCIKGYCTDQSTNVGAKCTPLKETSPIYNYPNPFASSTTIRYTISGKGAVSLALYSASGRKVRSLVDKQLSAGTYTASWNGRDTINRRVANGVYYAVLTVKTATGIRTERTKLFLVK